MQTGQPRHNKRKGLTVMSIERDAHGSLEGLRRTVCKVWTMSGLSRIHVLLDIGRAQKFFCALRICSASGAVGGVVEWNSPVHAQDIDGHGSSPRVLAACSGAGAPERFTSSFCSLMSSRAPRLLVNMACFANFWFCRYLFTSRVSRGKAPSSSIRVGLHWGIVWAQPGCRQPSSHKR